VLQEAAKLICRNVRDRGIAARFGGEEFVAAFAAQDTHEAAAVCERIRSSISEIDIIPAKVTASVGLAAVEPIETDFSAAIARADAALYRAKEAGEITWRSIETVLRLAGHPIRCSGMQQHSGGRGTYCQLRARVSA
jgi:diguanylate cyclase (GGDEF)-like protein